MMNPVGKLSSRHKCLMIMSHSTASLPIHNGILGGDVPLSPQIPDIVIQIIKFDLPETPVYVAVQPTPTASFWDHVTGRQNKMF